MTITYDIVTEYKGKGAQKATSDLEKLGDSAKKIAGALGVAFSLGAVTKFAAASVKAFSADQAAAKALELQLINTGNSFATDSVESYIASLQKTYHVLDDNLRPAYQTLLTSTGSVLDTQKALNVALDISAATGKSLEEVSSALAKGYNGQTTAITRLGVGIDKATIASGDMNKILDVLSGKFKGQAAAAADTYQGKLNALAVSSANVKEIIGKGIIDSLTLLGKDTNIETATTAMESFATSVANVTLGISLMIKKLKDVADSPAFPIMSALSWVFTNTSGLGLLSKLGAAESAKMNAPKSNFTYSLGAGAESEIAASKQKQIEAERLKIQKAQLDAQKKSLKAQQDAAKLKKGQGILDIEQAGILAALQGKITENEKLRLELQLALLTGNAKEADRLSNALLISQAQTTGLATFIANLPKALNPFADYPFYVQQALDELAKLGTAQKNLGSQTPTNPLYQYNTLSQQMVQGTTSSNAMGYGGGVFNNNLTPSVPLYGYNSMPQSTYNITVNGATQGLLDELRNGLIDSSASASNSKLNRLALMD